VKRATGRKPVPVWDLEFDPTVFESFKKFGDVVSGITKLPEDLKYRDYDAFRKHGLRALQMAAEGATATTGMPFSFPLRTGRGVARIKDEGIMSLLYPASRLKDMSVEAAMADRLMRSTSWQTRYQFVKWFDGLPQEKQQRFVEYAAKQTDTQPERVANALEKVHDRLFAQGDMFEKSVARLEKDLDDGSVTEDVFKEKLGRVQREGRRYAALMQKLGKKQKK
jgi:hypothetical protein